MMLVYLCWQLLECSKSLLKKGIDIFQYRHLSVEFGRGMSLVHARFRLEG